MDHSGKYDSSDLFEGCAHVHRRSHLSNSNSKIVMFRGAADPPFVRFYFRNSDFDNHLSVLLLLKYRRKMKYRKMSKDLQDQLRQAALLLRFRSTTPTSKSRKYLSYIVISETLRLTHNEVSYICTKSLKPSKLPTLKKKARILEQEHIDFLVHPKTLELWAGLTLQRRC